MSSFCGLPLPPKAQYCAMAEKHPHAEVAHLCALARGEIKDAPRSKTCPRTGESVCRCGEPYKCDSSDDGQRKSLNNVVVRN